MGQLGLLHFYLVLLGGWTAQLCCLTSSLQQEQQLCWRSSDGRVVSSRMLEQRNEEAWRTAAARQQRRTVLADRQTDSAWRCRLAAAAAALDYGAVGTVSRGAGQQRQQQRDLKQMGIADAGWTCMGPQSYQHVASLEPWSLVIWPAHTRPQQHSTSCGVEQGGVLLWLKHLEGCAQLSVDSGGS